VFRKETRRSVFFNLYIYIYVCICIYIYIYIHIYIYKLLSVVCFTCLMKVSTSVQLCPGPFKHTLQVYSTLPGQIGLLVPVGASKSIDLTLDA